MKRMKRYRYLLFPLALGLYPPLLFYSENLMLFGFSDMLQSIALTLVLTACLWLILYYFTRSIYKSSLVSGLIVFALLSHGQYRILLVAFGFSEAETTRYLLQLPYVFATGLLIYGLLKLTRKHEVVRDALVAFSIILVLFPAYSLGRVYYEQYGKSNAALIERNHSGTTQDLSDSDELPNIVMLMLDGYARADVLRELYYFDNSGFVAALEERGFYVAMNSRANYSGTLPSLASTWNMAYIDSINALKGRNRRQRTRYAEAFKQGEVWKLFKEFGYQTANFDVVDILVKRDADIVIETGAGLGDSPHFSFLNQTFHVILAKAWRSTFTTPPPDDIEIWKNSILKIFDQSIELSQSTVPTYAFAHVISPHPPFVFFPGKNPQIPLSSVFADGSNFHRMNNSRADYYLAAYAQQVDGLNQELIGVIDELLDSPRPVILVLFSDHGPGAFFDYDSNEGNNDWERLSNFIAVYAPDGRYDDFYDGMTLVNLFPLVFNTWLGTDIPLREDRSYRWQFLSGNPPELVNDELDAWDARAAGNRKN
jgi:hypothetical protein